MVKMDKERENDIFLIQSRLLRLCQIKWDLYINDVVDIFNKYNIFDESTDMWLNGPDYITNEYYLEKTII